MYHRACPEQYRPPLAPPPTLHSHIASRIWVNLSHLGWAQDVPRSEVTFGTACCPGQLPGPTESWPPALSTMWVFERGYILCSSAVNLEKNLRNPFRSAQFLQIFLLIFLPFTLGLLP